MFLLLFYNTAENSPAQSCAHSAVRYPAPLVRVRSQHWTPEERGEKEALPLFFSRLQYRLRWRKKDFSLRSLLLGAAPYCLAVVYFRLGAVGWRSFAAALFFSCCYRSTEHTLSGTGTSKREEQRGTPANKPLTMIFLSCEDVQNVVCVPPAMSLSSLAPTCRSVVFFENQLPPFTLCGKHLSVVP